MCNLIHEEIISHPITGSQEDQVRSVLPFFLSSLIDSINNFQLGTYLYKNPMLRQVRSQNKKNKKKNKKNLAYLGTVPYQPSHLTSNA